MISAQEALKLAVSEDLSVDERGVYNKITNHIDSEIKSNFNGVSVSIRIDSTYMNGAYFRLSEALPKAWRQNVIVNKILREYREGGWKIEEKSNIKAYTFTIDPSSTRDEKLKKILDGKE